MEIMVNVKQILRDIEKGENQKIEFKESYRWNIRTNSKDQTLKNEVVKAVCALGNSKGGVIHIGISDNKEIRGIQKDFETYSPTNKVNTKDKMIQDVKRKLSTALGPKINDLTNLSFNNIEEKEVLSIEVKPSKEPLFVDSRDFHYREG
jgi:predicted HTH transcriptional regulator